MSRQIIALVGFKGSGKDTVGAILKRKYGFRTTSFAHALKRALCVMFDWQPRMLEGVTPASRTWRETPDAWWSEKLGREITPRSMMQEFGTQLVRHRLDSSFWVHRTELELNQMPESVVVTDARFPDEIAMIRSKGGIIVRVDRGENPNWVSHATWINQQPRWIQKLMLMLFMPHVAAVHESERAWLGQKVDHVISNQGTLAELEAQVDQLMQQLMPTPES